MINGKGVIIGHTKKRKNKAKSINRKNENEKWTVLAMAESKKYNISAMWRNNSCKLPGHCHTNINQQIQGFKS